MTVLTDVLDRAAQVWPRQPAIQLSGRWADQAEFRDRVRALARFLVDLGVRRGDRVAVLMQNGPEYLDAYFAVPALGAILVPLNTRDSTAGVASVVDDATPRVLLTDAANHAMAGTLAARVRVVTMPEDLATGPADVLDADVLRAEVVAPADPACLLYTGGSTGRTKAAVHTHGSLVANAQHMVIAAGYRADDVYLHAAPMFHLVDSSSLYALTWVGAAHAFVPSFDVAEVLTSMADAGVTTTLLVPTMLRRLVEAVEAGAAPPRTLRLLVHGGAPMSPALCDTAARVLPGVQLNQGYGTTEAGAPVTMLQHEQELVGSPRLASVGVPVLGARVEVRDGDRPCDTGEVGEVVVRGPMLMDRYWRRPAETSRGLRDGWWHTGDLGYLDEEHHLFLTDRVSDVIISGGENVYCGPVESAIADHPDVAEVAVVGRPDADWGERVHAVVVPRPGRRIDLPDLRRFLQGRLARYQVPHSCEMREELPRSAAGKVTKGALR